MKSSNRLLNWEETISEFIKKSDSIALGLFTIEGKLLDANDLMCVFLKTDKQKLEPANFFVNPTFGQLAQIKNGDEIIFEGLLTIGNYSDQSFVLSSKIIRKADELLVLAKADIKQMFEDNAKMSHLNQEVNNLQRQLIKEKKVLQSTLAELKETQQMLIHSEKMNAIGQLVAGVAHEINNPISFVNSNLYSLENYITEILQLFGKVENAIAANAPQNVVDLVQKIQKENDFEFIMEDILEIVKESKGGINRVKTIVEDLRRFSRLDESAIKHIDLIENIRSTISIVNSEIANKNIQFDFISDEKLEIDCFPGQLNQAILNIIINAVYAVQFGGKIKLTVAENEKNVQISLKDNGCGIPAEIVKKIFDPFFTTKPVGTGTGLGLSITYKIIHDLHKGEIEVKSVPDKGTEITFYIPKSIN